MLQPQKMAEQQERCVSFWEVSGSIACPCPETVRYGGNISCLEILCGDRRLIFYAGTGLRKLGGKLVAQGPLNAHNFLTCCHFDHVCGPPFFVPFFIPGNQSRRWASHLLPENILQQVLIELMIAPLFPVPPDNFQADVTYNNFYYGETITLGDGIMIRTAPLNHPNRATGYRIDFAGKSICYLTDTEHFEDGPDRNLLDLAGGANLVICVSCYTDEEYPRFKGFGHFTWQEGIRLVKAAGAISFVICHHDSSHDDEFMDDVSEQVEMARRGIIVPREGMNLRL